MGEYQLVYTAVGALVFVAIIIGGRMFVVNNFIDADFESITTSRELAAMDIAYSTMDCFQKGSRSVQMQYLQDNSGKNLCDLCGICSMIAEAEITDMESDAKEKWKFDYSLATGLTTALSDKLAVWKGDEGSRKTFSVYTNIDMGENTHIGRIDVSV